MYFRNSKFRWMTLIEVLLAMIIFGIWIMSIFSAISWALWSLQESSKKTAAVFLAKEGIDILIYNKNQALSHGLPWNCAAISLDNSNGWICDHTLLDPGEILATYSIMYDGRGYHLEKDGLWYLSYSSASWWFLFLNATQQHYDFQRKLIISPVPWYESNSDKVLKVVSEVSYGWNLKNQKVILESYIAKTEY